MGILSAATWPRFDAGTCQLGFFEGAIGFHESIDCSVPDVVEEALGDA
jgi:hypothetical protein